MPVKPWPELSFLQARMQHGGPWFRLSYDRPPQQRGDVLTEEEPWQRPVQGPKKLRGGRFRRAFVGRQIKDRQNPKILANHFLRSLTGKNGSSDRLRPPEKWFI